MAYIKDPRVDAYIDALPDWQQAVCRQVRDLVHAADPQVEETIKRTVQPYFVLDGNICALLAAKDHVNVFLYDGAIVPDPDRIITGGHGNKTARTVAVREGERLPAGPLAAMFAQIIANNRAGGWRKLTAAKPDRPPGHQGPAGPETIRARHDAIDPRVHDYIDAMDSAHKPLFDRLHALIVEVHPDVEVVFSYKMPTYRLGRRKFYLAAWKHGVSLYGWPQGRDGGFTARHPELVSGVRTIRLRPQDAARITDDEIRAFVRAALGDDQPAPGR